MPGASAEQPTVNIVGERVALGPLRRDLLAAYQRWLNDLAMAPMLGNTTPLTAEQAATWYERQEASGELAFLIYEVATWRPIGTATLYDIHHQYRRASYGVLGGEAEARGQN